MDDDCHPSISTSCKGRVEFEDGWLIKSSFITMNETKVCQLTRTKFQKKEEEKESGAQLDSSTLKWFQITCTVKPVLTATSEQRPPVNKGHSEAITASLSLTYHWSFSDSPLHNDHIFQVPRVAVVYRFDCIDKISVLFTVGIEFEKECQNTQKIPSNSGYNS